MVYQMTQAIIDLIASQIDRHIYHGASLALFEKEGWSEYYIGTLDGLKPVEPDLIYDLASVSKVVGVGTVVIFLLNRGVLDIDEPLVTYYPDFWNVNVTLRQLLTHTSGIDPYIPNRSVMSASQLKTAIDHIRVTSNKRFQYTDINFILLGFMLESVCSQSLDQIFHDYIFQSFSMTQTGFGPVKGAVETISGIKDGRVHDPKAKVLGIHAGSAGLFSTLKDLEKFSEHYLQDDFSDNLWQDYGNTEKKRSIAWDLDGDWIEHTGYTGPYILLNRKAQRAAIFLTNRTYSYDDRQLWIEERRHIRDAIKENRRRGSYAICFIVKRYQCWW
jgi:CubicO group peptidase (beta-lactamase class C family)